jgi:MEDS: MEthanogen/methylotroph, DcmR Sensory domain
MSSPPPWQPLLRSAQPCDHIVQLYTDEMFLARAVTQFIGAGLLAGEAGVIIATPRHISAFDLQLGTLVDVANARVRDQLVVLDAEASLARLMVGGQPDRDVFRAFVMGRRRPASGLERAGAGAERRGVVVTGALEHGVRDVRAQPAECDQRRLSRGHDRRRGDPRHE